MSNAQRAKMAKIAMIGINEMDTSFPNKRGNPLVLPEICPVDVFWRVLGVLLYVLY